ncbi:MAG TPA: serine/threonine-protein kinase, partial [Polyangia bacterium]
MASTRLCPVCGRRGHEETSAFCLTDGTRLREEESLARIGMRLRDYDLHAVLGEGGMGTVYRAVHVMLEKPVAVKVLRQEFSLRKEVVGQFLVEAKAASRIRHPNIIDVTDFGITDDGLVFLVMEYLEGESLQMRLRRVGRMGIFEAVGIVNQIARALFAAHEEKVVHRDLKPENVFLERRRGRRRVVERQPSGAVQMFGVKDEGSFDFVKIVDFGVAKLLDSGPGRNTRAGLLWGTPCYVSPEQARGQKVDGRSDIYSLGAMFYEMVTGQVPFEAETMLDLLGKHLHEEVVPPYERAPDASIDTGTNDTIVRCLAKNPDDRFQTMDELCDALLGCFTDRIFLRDADRMSGAVESGISVPPKPTFRPRKLTAEKTYAMVRSPKGVLHRLRWPAAAMLVTLVVIGAGWYVYARA